MRNVLDVCVGVGSVGSEHSFIQPMNECSKKSGEPKNKKWNQQNQQNEKREKQKGSGAIIPC